VAEVAVNPPIHTKLSRQQITFIAAGVNFGVGALVSRMGTLGKPVAFTAVAFGVGLLIIPLAVETRGRVLPD
jgi:hypothetical protein